MCYLMSLFGYAVTFFCFVLHLIPAVSSFAFEGRIALFACLVFDNTDN